MSFLTVAATTSAFDGHRMTEGPLMVTIAEVADVTEYGAPREVTVTAQNRGDQPLSLRLKMAGLVDEWRAVGETERT
ncbi:MAG: hypothetical protein FJ278_12500, partial [Planctomycetes bacterium]|nr:hypothetical protein [Planctomycetota bacterium]